MLFTTIHSLFLDLNAGRDANFILEVVRLSAIVPQTYGTRLFVNV